jgi:hypothetical protein
VKFTAVIKPSGTLHIINRAGFDDFVRSQARGGDVEFTLDIERKKNRRTLTINRYWWGVLVPVVQRGLYNMGHDLSKEEVHEFLKAQFNFTEIVNEDTGEIMRLPLSTSKLSGSEFWKLVGRVAQWAAEWLGENIPPPGEQAEIEHQW